MSEEIQRIPYENLPLGFRFDPTGEQLIEYYLKRRIDGTIKPWESAIIPDMELCKLEPWDIARKLNFLYGECFFFTRIDRKYKIGTRLNRATEMGYWKPTGTDRSIHSRKAIVGTVRMLVFHGGKKGKGIGTGWIIHEYSVVEEESAEALHLQGKFVLCRLFKKERITNKTTHEEATDVPNQVPSPNMGNLLVPHHLSLVPTIELQAESNSADGILTAHSEVSVISQEESLFDDLEDILESDYYRSFISDDSS